MTARVQSLCRVVAAGIHHQQTVTPSLARRSGLARVVKVLRIFAKSGA
jgi:hypothetical protein